MEKDLEELEKEFILNEDIEQEDLRVLISRILKFCRIDNKGFVIIYGKQLRIVDKIFLVLSARHLANKIQIKNGKEPTISENVGADELEDILREKRAVIFARLKDLKYRGYIIPQGKGVYKAFPHTINKFLTELEKND